MNDITRRTALGGLVAGAAGAVMLDRSGGPRSRPSPAQLLTATSGIKNRPFWLHYDSSPISQATIDTEAPRRGRAVFNACERQDIPAFHPAGPCCHDLTLD